MPNPDCLQVPYSVFYMDNHEEESTHGCINEMKKKNVCIVIDVPVFHSAALDICVEMNVF